MVESLVDVFDGLATQSNEQMKIKFLQIESSVKSKLDQVFSALNQLRFRKEPILEFEDECIDEEEEENVSTQVLQKQKNQNIDLLAGSLGKIMQPSSSLWLQQQKLRH